MIYLAIPYTGNEKRSFEMATEIAAELSIRGRVVYSPITHSHPMTQYRDLPGTWDFWSKIDHAFIDGCECIYVIMADGWEQSTGVQAEIEYAQDIGMPVYYFEPEDFL